MKTVTINVCKIDELSPEAREYALNHYRETRDEYFWADEAYESLKDFCNIFNIRFNSATFSANANVEYSLSGIEVELSGVRLYKYIYNNYWEYLWEKKGLGGYKERKPGKWGYKKRSFITLVETSCPFTGYCMDESLLQPIRDFMIKPKASVTFEDLLMGCINQWEIDASFDCQEQDSDEYIAEHMEANDYEFTEDGKRY